MRLGQLSRKLSVRPAEIVAFLKNSSVEIEESSNARIDDAHLNKIIDHFAPGLNLQQDSPPANLAPQIEQETPEIITAETILLDEAAVSNDFPQPNLVENLEQNGNEQPDETTPVEVIKAPKIELQGLKVIGKIELPQTKKKESEISDGTPDETVPSPPAVEKLHKERKSYSQNRRPQSERPRKNPVALERERQEREAAEKKKLIAELKKEKKKQHYYKKVKTKGPTKSARLYNEPVTTEDEIQDQDQPTSWWGRFIKWLTSY